MRSWPSNEPGRTSHHRDGQAAFVELVRRARAALLGKEKRVPIIGKVEAGAELRRHTGSPLRISEPV